MSIPADGIDSTWGEGGINNGSTNYGTIMADANNYLEVWHNRESQMISLVAIQDGAYVGAINLDSAWLNLDGRFHWAVSYSETDGLKFAILNRGNEVESGSLGINLDYVPTTLRVGSHDWLSVPTVGVKSAFYDSDNAQTLEELQQRVLRDTIYTD